MTSTPGRGDRLRYNFKTYKSNKDDCSYINLPCSFDIETSSFRYGDDEKTAILYAFEICINGYVYIGKSYDDLLKAFDKIVRFYNLNEHRRMIFYVHNLSFEWQFIKHYFSWLSVFALQDREILKCTTTSGIEFRCSYKLSGYSLEKVGEHLQKYKVKKLVGDLDYSKIRTPETPLNCQEIHYLVNDGLVVVAYIKEEMEAYQNNITRLPLTATGKVRQYTKHACFYDDENKKRSYYKKMKYYHKMRYLTMTTEDYTDLKNAFQGGFTHASNIYSGSDLRDVSSYDFTSAYPSVMISEKYPCTHFRSINKKIDKNLLEYFLETKCCLFNISLFDLREKDDRSFEHYISKSKCLKYDPESMIVDNGRVVSCAYINITLTEIDFKIIREYYSFSRFVIHRFKVADKDYLPRDFVRSILDLYKKKTELKGVEGQEVEYMRSKGMLNSEYGMCVMDPCRPEFELTDDMEIIGHQGDVEKSLEKYNKSKSRYLYYPWGVWITAYNRRNLFKAISECGHDYVYSDTDSVKILHRERHDKWFQEYNRRLEKRLRDAMEHHGLDFEMCRPRTQKGVQKLIGAWDYEGDYKRFKTLGAKRYMVVDKNGEMSITMSGVDKSKGLSYLKNTYRTEDKIFQAFDDQLYIPPVYVDQQGRVQEATGKKTHVYVDIETEGDITDYLGRPYHFDQKSALYLEPAEYTLSIEINYIRYLQGVREETRYV